MEMKQAADAATVLRKNRAITVYKLQKLRAMRAMKKRKERQQLKLKPRHDVVQEEETKIIVRADSAQQLVACPAQSA